MPQRLIHQQFLKINDADMNGVTLTSSGTAYLSAPIKARYSNGYSAFVPTFISGTALINVSFQVSLDASNWFTASTTDGTTLTAVGAIASSITASSWIVFTPRPAEWIRFSITVTSAGKWTMQYAHQEDAN